jgi:uncharacterized protein (DUF488 family)
MARKAVNELFTIGFTEKSAEDFFSRLRAAGAKRVIDVRLNNVSQLAGFSKRDDLRFFLKEIAGIGYIHLPLLAPTQEMLDEYRKSKTGWDVYERKFNRLLEKRKIEREISPDLIKQACLLCSEDKPYHCHRRLIAEYLKRTWGDLEIVHL